MEWMGHAVKNKTIIGLKWHRIPKKESLYRS